MCACCVHWRRELAYDDHGLRFAPCALVPDRRCPDARNPAGYVDACYVMQDTYKCGKFAPIAAGRPRGNEGDSIGQG